MKLVLVFLYTVLRAVKSFQVEKVSSWVLNPKDQLALSLYQLFETNRYYTLRYSVESNATKIGSRDPQMTREFFPNCRHVNTLSKSVDSNPNTLMMICNYTDVYEMDVDQSTGRFKDFRSMANITGQECKALEYHKALNILGVFCFKKDEGPTGFYYFHTVDRTQKKVIGSVKYDAAAIKSYKFDERVKVRVEQLNKGGLKNEVVFIVTDEPYSDHNETILAKANSFAFVIQVDPNTKAPESLLNLDFKLEPLIKSANPLKFLAFEIIDTKLLAIYMDFSNAIKFVSCNINTASPSDIKLVACSLLNQNINMRFGVLSLTKTGLIGIFHRADMKYSVCGLNFASIQNVVTNCRFFEGRNETDLEVHDFESYNSTSVFLYYLNFPKTMSLGIDRIDLTATDAKVGDRFESFVDVSREIGGRFVTIQDSFVEIFNKTRTMEMILESRILYDNRAFKFFLKQVHEGNLKIKSLQGYRCGNFIGPIQKRGTFPRLVGFLGKSYRIPLGRSYFSGNGIQFGLNISTSLSAVTNAGPARIKFGDVLYDYVHSFFHSYGYQVLMVKDEKIFIVKCKKKIESDTLLSCNSQGLFEVDIPDRNETVLDIFESQQLLIVVTTRGIRRFDKILGTAQSFLPKNTFYQSVSFKLRDSAVVIAVLMKNDQSANPFIQLYETNMFDVSGIRLGGSINSYLPDPTQETGGDFCPKSVKFEIEDEPTLVVLNACASKDRRIIRFNIASTLKPVQMNNLYLRIPEFKRENLIMCPDQHVVAIAAPGTGVAIGLGYESQNLREDLGLTDLNVTDIKKMVCLGKLAIGLGFVNSSGVFKIATYYTGRLAMGDNRLHSILEFPELGQYRDFSGSEGNGVIFYNVYNQEGKNYLRSVYLNGPELYVRSDTRKAIYDSQILSNNLARAENFILELNFIPQKSSTAVSSKTKKVQLGQTEYNIDKQCLFDGPVFNLEFNVPSVATIIPRIGEAKELLDGGLVETHKIVYASATDTVGTVMFLLVQSVDSSLVVVRDTSAMDQAPVVVPIQERCKKINVLQGTNHYHIFLSCQLQSEWRFFIYSIDLTSKAVLIKRYSSVIRRTRTMGVERTSKNDSFVLATIDEMDRLDVYYFSLSFQLDDKGKVNFEKKYNTTEGSLV